jgi:actin-related protein 8
LIATDAKDAEAREAAAKLAPQEAEDQSSEEETEQNGGKVIVIHPGSRNLRIGLASQTFPYTIPMVIARPSAATFKVLPPLPLRIREDPESQEPLFGQTFEDGVQKIDAILKARLKAAKKRTVPNARELVASYNRRSQYEELLDINDPEQIEWTDLGPDQKYCIGNEVSPFIL